MGSKNTILIRNIYHMLSYAFQELRKNNYDNIAEEDFKQILDLFAEILFRGVSEQLKQGLYKEYIERHETLSIMRGRLDINGTIRNIIQRKRYLDCEYDELSINNQLNRILKSTMLLLVRSEDVNTKRKRQLRSILTFFNDVDECNLRNIRWSAMCFQRNNRSYRMLMNICYFIVECSIMTTENGSKQMPTFSDEHMNRLFERFVLNYYKRHYPSLKANADAIKWNVFEDSESEGLDLLPSMQSDITLHGADHTLIIDTKYYSAMMQSQYDKKSIHSGNLYQIFTYVKNRDKEHLGNVSGMLLYAQTNEDIVPRVDTTIDGNRIMVRSLDLNCEFKDIQMQLNDIVGTIFPDAIPYM